MSTFINSLTYKVQFKDIILENVFTERCESGVDIFSNLKINFGNKFNSYINCSFKENLNQQTIINFEDGSLSIDQSWVPDQNMFVIQKKGNEISKIKFENNKNIYSYEIQDISNQILNNKKNPNFPSINFEEIETNTKILSHWINFG